MEDLFAGIFEEMFANLLLAPIGFVYLWLRYRNKSQVKVFLAKNYEDSFADAGRVVILNTIAGLVAYLVSNALI